MNNLTVPPSNQSTNIQQYIAGQTKTLIIDDSEITRQLLRKWCITHGFKDIREAANGVEGLRLAIDWQPNLIFLDVNMPEMDGMTMLAELHHHNLTSDKVIMMQTIVDDIASKSRAFEMGTTDFITKPLHQKEVMSRTLAHVERQYLHDFRMQEGIKHKEELRQAGQLQTTLMPQKRILKQIKDNFDTDIAYYYRPADLVSGDYCGVRLLEDNNICLLTADVAGHGVSSALYTFSIHSMIEYIFHNNVEPSLALAELNHELYHHFPNGKFASMFMGIIDQQEQTLKYATAACPEPLFIRDNKIMWLDSTGYLIGSLKKAHYETKEIKYQAGDILLLYSDALVENYLQPEKAMPRAHISEIIYKYQDKDANTILESLVHDFLRYYNNQNDDLTLLLCKF
jgi:sigma-B regulation protein RsbU (phosphoserine phosphatase)